MPIVLDHRATLVSEAENLFLFFSFFCYKMLLVGLCGLKHLYINGWSVWLLEACLSAYPPLQTLIFYGGASEFDRNSSSLQCTDRALYPLILSLQMSFHLLSPP